VGRKVGPGAATQFAVRGKTLRGQKSGKVVLKEEKRRSKEEGDGSSIFSGGKKTWETPLHRTNRGGIKKTANLLL